MNNVGETRRANIRALVAERGGLTKLARILGYKNPSFLSQMISANPTREVTERTARGIEEALGLPDGHLDRDQGAAFPVSPATPQPDMVITTPTGTVAVEVKSVPAGAQSADSAQRMVDIVRVVGAAWEQAGLAMQADRFAELVALVYADSAEREVRPDHVKRLVHLLR
ncbi:MAG: hypothetical protein RIS35_2483 [Pseudomonadota bacterium]|jgi:hypothetical protein